MQAGYFKKVAGPRSLRLRGIWTVVAAIMFAPAAAYFQVSARAALILPAWLGDHMVVQTGQPVFLEGGGASGGEVTISVGEERVRATVTGDRWTAVLPARKASAESFVIRIEAGAEAVEIKDVLAGEVLLCAGQSNMDMAVSRMDTAEQELADADRLGGVLRLLDFTACNPGKRALTETELSQLAEGRVYDGRWTVAGRASTATSRRCCPKPWPWVTTAWGRWPRWTCPCPKTACPCAARQDPSAPSTWAACLRS